METLHFHVAGPAGAGPRLVVHAPRSRPCAVDAAILLERCEPLLGALDAWFGDELDWIWRGAHPLVPTARSAGFASASWLGEITPDPTSLADDPPAVRLEVPWALLREAGAPPAALAALLEWDQTPAVFVLAELSLDADEQACLEPGGAVLIAESRRVDGSPPWITSLVADANLDAKPDGYPDDSPADYANDSPNHYGNDNAITWRLDTPSPGCLRAIPDPDRRPGHFRSGHACSETGSQTGTPAVCRIVARFPAGLDIAQRAGWSTAPVLFSEADPRLELRVMHGHRRSGPPLATGRLLPWGRGWAMRVEE